MAARADDRICYEFDDFFVDPVRRLLLRGSDPVAVTPKALSILLYLLERSGGVVDKAELIEAVWAGSHVTEANLTQNVFALRKALGERANDPRYVVTVPGRGYSFAGEVRRIRQAATGQFPIVSDLPAPAPSPPVPPPARVETPAAAGPPPLAAVVEPPAALGPPRRRSAARWATLAGLAALGAVLLGFLHVRYPRPTAAAHSSRPSIVVLGFRNLSPRSESHWLQTALPAMLTTELAAGGKVRVLTGEAVAQAERNLSFQDDGSLGRDDLARLHSVLGADQVVLGTYLSQGDKIRLDLRVVRAPEADTTVSVSEVGTGMELFDLVSRVGARLRESLGVAAPSPEQARQARALQPASQEATRLYNEGLLRLRAFDPPGARALFQRAVEADPGSAVIHAALSQAWASLGYDARAEAEAHRALDLAGSLSREERLAIEARLYQVSQQWDRAAETYRSLWTFFPDEIEYGLHLADCQTAGGHGAEAAATLAALRKLPAPAGQDPRIDLAEARNASRLSDFATEKSAGEIAAAKGRRSDQPLVVSRALIYQGDALVRTGRAREAIDLFRESKSLAQKAGHQWQVGMSLSNIASALRHLGDLDGAEKADQEALGIAQRAGSGIGLAYEYFALGEIHQSRGELEEAQRLFDQSRSWYVEIGDRLMQARTLVRLGQILYARGDLAAAQQRLEAALHLSQSMANPVVEAQSLDHLGTLQALQGGLAVARSRHQQAFAIFHRVGDEDLASSSLTALADVEARLGDLRSAWQHSAQALLAKRQAGDKLGIARILDSRSRLAYDRGDLAVARELAEDQLRLARETGAKPLAAGALRNLGRTALAAGDLAGARKSLGEALAVSSSLGENLATAEIRLAFAELALASGHPADAAGLARKVASFYHQHKIDGREAAALALLGEALLDQGLRAEARQAGDEARARLGTSDDLELRLEIAPSLARLTAAGGHPAEALRDLREAIASAERIGLMEPALEARLALGQIQHGLGDPAAGAVLAAVRRDAETHGYRRLAALAAPVPPRAAPLG
ncbi:MAG TPA: tetratricopeptide repeat protein [Thermoanaerobaculia bacterium]|nr:tetratricopeptide repeat protein [Thermoanaerobaculia bacterium]